MKKTREETKRQTFTEIFYVLLTGRLAANQNYNTSN